MQQVKCMERSGQAKMSEDDMSLTTSVASDANLRDMQGDPAPLTCICMS